jgi:hypothetical protein
LTWSHDGHAQAAAQASAADHFERGIELYQEGSLDAALVEFERAYESVPDYRVLYNLAQVQTQRGEYVEAIALFEKYLAEGGESITPERKTEVEQDLVKLNGRVARLWVESNADGAELFINGKQVGVLPLTQPVLINSGVCDIRVTRAGYEPRLHQVKVAGGEKPRVSLPLTAIAPTPVAPAQRSPLTARTRTEEVSYTPFWVSFGAAAVLGGASGGLGYWALQRRNDMDDELAKLPANRDLVEARSNDVRRFSLWADVCGAAAVVAGGTALYFLISPSKSTTDEDAVVSSLEIRTNGTSAVLSGMF